MSSNTQPSPITVEDLELINSKSGLLTLLRDKKIDVKKVLRTLRYERTLTRLQTELVRLQRSVQDQNRRVALLFEGRDAAGKGGTIQRFTQHLMPRGIRVVALPKPSEAERGQWYFQRYARQLPDPGEIVFFDRSWYNRAVVEPVNGFCNEEQYERFMRQVPEFESMLHESGIELVKFWFAITKEEQQKRFDDRRSDPLKNWKISPVDKRAQELWDSYTYYSEEMFARTHTAYSPWLIVEANNKKKARLASIRYVLTHLDYDGKKKAKVDLHPDPDIVARYHHD